MCVHTTYATVLRTEIIHITFLLHLEIYEAIVMSELPDAMMLRPQKQHDITTSKNRQSFLICTYASEGYFNKMYHKTHVELGKIRRHTWKQY